MRTWEEKAIDAVERRKRMADDALECYRTGKIKKSQAFGLLRKAENITQKTERFWEQDYDYSYFNQVAKHVHEIRQQLKGIQP